MACLNQGRRGSPSWVRNVLWIVIRLELTAARSEDGMSFAPSFWAFASAALIPFRAFLDGFHAILKRGEVHEWRNVFVRRGNRRFCGIRDRAEEAFREFQIPFCEFFLLVLEKFFEVRYVLSRDCQPGPRIRKGLVRIGYAHHRCSACLRERASVHEVRVEKCVYQ